MRIGIVNDLRLAVESLRRTVATMPEATIAWIAEDGAQAVAKCAVDRPDIVLMDMIMPVMDGVEATRRIMKDSPCPILVVTSTVTGNADKVFEALGAGALDAVQTPTLAQDGSVRDPGPLVRKIRAVDLIAGARRTSQPMPVAPTHHLGAKVRIAPMVAIGSSTGGPQALATILPLFPKPSPWPVVIVQHVDPTFAPGLAEWLSRISDQPVEIARAGDTLESGRILLAATTDHLIIDDTGRLRYAIEPTTMVYRPSVDVFFDSILAADAAPGVAAVLTGMGRDGAAGLARLREAGWYTIAQDKASSVVWGMPGAAVEIGAAMETLTVGEIGNAITARLTAMSGYPRRTA